MKIQTVKLQSLAAKSLKGAGLNRLIPITTFLSIKSTTVNEKSALEFTTTDGVNYLYLYSIEDDIEDNFNAVVDVEMFSKLISKLTCEYTELSIDAKKSTLHIKGNGEYDIPLQFDENGELVKYPNPIENVVFTTSDNLKVSTVLNALNYCRSFLSSTTDEPVYMNYYAGNDIVATDSFKICKLNEHAFNKPLLISSAMMNLLKLIEDENIDVLISDEYIEFVSSTATVVGNVISGIEDYQIDAINELLNQNYASSCKVSVSSLYEALDRVSLFIDVYDNDGVKLVFSDGYLCVESIKTTGAEKIKLSDEKDPITFRCTVSNSSLLNLLKSVTDDVVEIQYGEPNAIKLIHDNVIQVVSLLDD